MLSCHGVHRAHGETLSERPSIAACLCGLGELRGPKCPGSWPQFVNSSSSFLPMNQRSPQRRRDPGWAGIFSPPPSLSASVVKQPLRGSWPQFAHSNLPCLPPKITGGRALVSSAWAMRGAAALPSPSEVAVRLQNFRKLRRVMPWRRSTS